MLSEKAAGLLASPPAGGHRLQAFVSLAAVIGVATWAVGLIFFLVRMVHGWLAVRRICRDASPLDRDRFASLIEGVEKRFGLRRPLQIVVSDQIGTAAALGGLDQQIILPTSYVAQLSPEELEPVLIHETAHLVRRDHRIAVLQRLAAAVYWPHPLVHVLNRRLARAREECCDNYVLQQLDPRRYAQLLLRLAEWPAAWMPPAPTLAFFSRRWKLEERIADLLDARRQSAVRPRRPFVLVAGAAIGAVALASAGLRLTQASDKPADGRREPAIDRDCLGDGSDDGKESLSSCGRGRREGGRRGGRRAAPPQMDLPGHASVQLGGLRFRTEASDLAFLPDGKTIVSASWRGGITYWDIATGRVKLHVRAKADKMRITADRKRLVTQDVHEGAPLQVWNAADGKHIADLKWAVSDPLAAEVLQTLTPDGTAAILSNRHGQVSIRELATGRLLKQQKISSQNALSVAVSPSGARLAITMGGNQLFLWDWQTANPQVEVDRRHRTRALAFSPDGKRLAAGGYGEDELRIFNMETHDLERVLRDPKGEPLLVDDLAFTPDGKQLAAANFLRSPNGFFAGILIWDTDTRVLRHRFTIPAAYPQRLAISADGKLLAAAMEKSLHVWSLETGKTVGGETRGHTAAVSAVCFSPKGDRIVTASDDGTARIWNGVSGRELHQLDHNSQWVRAATVSPDGALVATSGLDDKVGIWQMETGKSVHVLKGHGNAGGWRAVQFSANGSVLYSWGDDYKLREWEVVTGQLKRAFSLKRSGTHDGDALWAEEHQGIDEESIGEQCTGVCFRDGGKQLVLAARDRYWIFDTVTGREVGSHMAPLVSMTKKNQPTTAPISALVCSETGNNILISSAAPYVSRRLPSGAWRGETVGSDKLTLVALGSGLPLWSTTLNGIGVNPIALSPDGRIAADGMAGPRGASLAILDGKTGSLVRTIEGVDPQHNSYRQAAFSPDGNRFAVAQHDGTVLIWDLAWLGVKPAR